MVKQIKISVLLCLCCWLIATPALAALFIDDLTGSDKIVVNNSKDVAMIKTYFEENSIGQSIEEYVFILLKNDDEWERKEYGKIIIKSKEKNIFLTGRSSHLVLNANGELIAFSSHENNIPDINFFSRFPKLKALAFSRGVNNKAKHLAVKGFPALENLVLTDVSLESIDLQLSGDSLRYLSLYRSPLNKLTGLGKLTKLKYLDLSKNKLKKIEGIENLHQLQYLNIAFSDTEELPSFKAFPELIVLDAKSSKVATLIDFGSLTKLTRTELHGVPGIVGLTRYPRSLKTLFIVGDLDAVPADIANLQQLEELVMGDGGITKIEHVSGLQNLKKLTISYSKITKIEGLTDLPKLEYLRLHHNPIKKIAGLEDLVSLNKLLLDATDIKKIEGLDHLPHLEWVELKDTKITKVENLKQIPSLKYIELHDAPIYDYDLTEVEGVKATIKLSGTPYQTQLRKNNFTFYRQLLRAHKI